MLRLGGSTLPPAIVGSPGGGHDASKGALLVWRLIKTRHQI